MWEATGKLRERVQAGDVLGWASALALLAVVLAAFAACYATAHVARRVGGTVESADWRLNEDTGQTYPFIEVKLDGGSSVRVGSMAPALPGVGDRITVRQRAMLFNYMTVYEWERPSELFSEREPVLVPRAVSHP
jgi:hypothetical protein